MKQVDTFHYEFRNYMHKERWISVWHQLHEVAGLNPQSVLEVGPGPGIFKATAEAFGIGVRTLDFDPDLKPDYVGAVTDMPLGDATFDVVCAFQVLEHLPYEEALRGLREMLRVSRRHVIISLPDANHVWNYRFHIPLVGELAFSIPRPRFRAPVHIFDGQHHWELGKRGYPVARFANDCRSMAKLSRTYRVRENTYHRFFVLERTDLPSSGVSA